MGKFIEFAEVLEQKIRKSWMSEQRPSEPQAKVQDIEDTSPTCLAQLLGKQPIYRSTLTGNKAYQRFHKPRPAHRLNAAQIAALAFFKSQGQELSASFSKRELKKAFRALAIRLHPDHGAGSSGDFIVLKNAYDLLSTV